jgi:hypothetical protein
MVVMILESGGTGTGKKQKADEWNSSAGIVTNDQRPMSLLKKDDARSRGGRGEKFV